MINFLVVPTCVHLSQLLFHKFYSCTSKDNAIMENGWTITNDHTYSIDMYAFRFVDSKDVTIECSAFICPLSDPECTKQIKVS